MFARAALATTRCSPEVVVKGLEALSNAQLFELTRWMRPRLTNNSAHASAKLERESSASVRNTSALRVQGLSSYRAFQADYKNHSEQ